MLLLLKSSSSVRQQRRLLAEEETGAYNMDRGLENMLNSGGGNTREECSQFFEVPTDCCKKSIFKKWNIIICNNMNVSRGYYAQWIESEKDKDRMITFKYGIWKTEQNENRLIVQRTKEGLPEKGGMGDWAKQVKWIKKYKLPVIK